jgi:hypothetical protein
MLVQLRDHDLLDTGFDDYKGLSRPMSDDSDEADLRYVERNLENDFGYEARIADERATLRATRRVIYARDYETEDECRRRRLAHARWLLAILEEHHGL